VIDGTSMLEETRVPSSKMGATRPVHSFISPDHGGKYYYVSLNDGQDGKPETNSANFIDLVSSSPTYLQAVGEVALGVGHHKAAFSSTKERVAISNIGDCDNVITVYDYSDVGSIKPLKTFTALDLGYDGSSFTTTCDPTYQMGLPPSPHGAATSKLSGKAYSSVTASGDIMAIDLDADPITFKAIKTGGSGGGYTKVTDDGRYIFSLQGNPREAGEGGMPGGGAKCQIGQLVVVDTMTDTVASELPLFYKGPDCSDTLTGSDEESTEPSHMQIANGGKTLFVTLSGGYGVDTARVRQVAVVDIANPAQPAQLPSIAIGTSTSYVGDTLSGDGKYLFYANNIDNTISQVDAVTRKVVKTIPTSAKPATLATFGSSEGPGHQTGPIE
jgi:YVTN family beta-propeller protein